MLRRRPSSTLFPYTTLFRSGPVQGKRPQLPAIHEDRVAVGIEVDSRGRRRDQDAARHRDARHLERGARGVDRKSTRLNSSHMSISYAVFCLKKKTRIKLVDQ